MEEFNASYLTPLLHKANTEGKKIFLLGDFNCDLLKSETNSEVSNFLDIMGSSSLCPQISLPTRVSNTSKTLIDNIFCSPNLDEQFFSGNILSGISDHLPQFLLIGMANSISNVQPVFKRQWSNFNQEKFILDYFNINWDEILKLENGDADASFTNFVHIVEGLLDVHVPIVKLTRKQARTLNKPWITPGILKSIQVRNILLRNFIKSNDPDTRNRLHNQYRSYRNLIVKLIRQSKTTFYSEYFQLHLNNSRKIWQGIREIISINSSSNKPPISLLINNSLTSDPCTVANSFNNFFSSIASSIRQSLYAPPKDFKAYLSNRTTASFFISPTSPQEVEILISSLSDSKASGPHSIPVRIIKLLKQDISKPLSDLFNLSFSTGFFPSILKTSKVIPVFKKKGSSNDVSNYRPISLLSNLDKLIEKLISKRLTQFLDKHQSIFNRQYGFRAKHSTEHALLSLTESIRKTLDSGQFVCGVFIDLQKAFDTVDHNILISKLQHYGIRGVASSWFNSYLSDRSQYVEINGFKSSTSKTLYGVPQGSVLGPLLFLIYINDLHNALYHSKPFLFADDTSLLTTGTDQISIGKKVNSDLKCLVSWLNANKIALNTTKTELILFRSKSKSIDENFKIKINGKRLYPSSFVKYLGIYLDEHLCWSKQINDLSQRLRRANGALSKLRHLMPNQILLNVYFAIFHSHLKYGCQVWGQNSKSDRIFLLQKAALRIISFANFYSPSSPLFAHSKILKLPDIVKSLNILLVHQCLNLCAPIDLYSLFSFTHLTQRIQTRGATKQTLTRPCVNSTTFGIKSITYSSISDWNSLIPAYPNTNLKTISFSKLQSLVKFLLLSKYV